MQRRRLVQGALVLLGVAALVLWLRSFDPIATWEYLRHTQIAWVAAFMASLAVAVTLRAVRLRAIVRPLCPIDLRASLEISYLGEFLNTTLAMRTGDVAKAGMLRQQKGLPVVSGLSLLVVDKLFDLWGLISVTGFGFALLAAADESAGNISGQVLALYPVLMIGLAVFLRLLATDWADARIRALAARPSLVGRVAVLAGNASAALRAVARMSPRDIFGLGLISSLVFAVNGLSVVCLFRAIGVAPSPGKVVLAFCLVALVFLIPVPGNIGTLEIGFSRFFGQLGVAGPDEINAVAILYHASLYATMLLLALGSFGRFRALMRSSPRPDETGIS